MMNDWYKPNYNSNSIKGYKSFIRNRIIAIIVLCVSIVSAVVVSIVSPASMNSNTSSAGTNTELPNDYKDFFNNYYTSVEDEKADISIPKYENEITYRVELKDSTKTDFTLQQLYANCETQIVSIKCSTDGTVDNIWGSGIIMSDDGLILTNTHVIDECKKVTVLINEKEYEAALVGADAVSDISILKIESEEKLIPAEFANTDNLMVGDKVAAIGSPLGSSFINTLTDGIISGIERDIPYNGHSMSYIQTNAALNEGNSGGALFNMKGQVIGITNMKMNSISVSIEGIGFAIPSSTIKTITDELFENGYIQRTTIGVVVGSIPKNVSSAYELPNGLYVTDVNEDSGAADAGIKVGDVITEINNTEITTTSDVNKIKDSMSAGDVMKITVFREGEYLEFDVTLK